MIDWGSGDGTTRRQLSPSRLTVQPRSLGEPVCGRLVVDGADRLARRCECRVCPVHEHLRQQRGDLAVRQLVAERLLEQVADHALALRPEHIERVGRDVGVGRRLQGEQADLGSVAVGDDQLVVTGELGEAARGFGDVAALKLGLSRLAALQQRVAAERGDDAHLLPPLDQRVDQRLLGREAVRGLLEDDRARPVDDLRGHFLTAVRWQAVHEQRVV